MKTVKCKCGYGFAYDEQDIIKRYRKRLNKDHKYDISYREFVKCKKCRKQIILRRKIWKNITNYLDN